MSELSDNLSVLESVRRLEERISRIEARLGLSPVPDATRSGEDDRVRSLEQHEALEQQIGQQLFAKLGIGALILGVGFLLTLPYRGLPPVLPAMLGYLIAGGTVGLARRYRAPLRHIAGYLTGGAIVLLFFATLRLHFFTPEAPVSSPALESALLGATALAGLSLAAFPASFSLLLLSLALVDAAALVSGEPLVVFAAAAAVIVAASLFAVRSRRAALLPWAAALAFATHLLWFLDFPLPGRAIAPPAAPGWNAYALLVSIALIAAGSLLQPRRPEEGPAAIATALVNAAGGYLLFVFVTLAQFTTAFVAPHLAAFLLFLTAAIVFWLQRRGAYATFIYAIAGYVALSAAIVAAFPPPACFLWLSWQSVLVVATAVWFHSRFIIIANFVIFLTLAAASLVLAGAVSPVTLSVGAAALVTAHILTVRKEGLGLNGTVMRNAYLACALFVIPVALAHWMPTGLVSQSWLMLALVYYLAARILHAASYRWMALLTLILTAGYVLLVDLARIEPIYRVISCIILGIVLLVVSLVYSRRNRRTQPPPTTDPPVPGTGTVSSTYKEGLRELP